MNTPLTSGIDRIDLMQTFIRIGESGSLSAAAVQLSTSQPTVSRRLQSLERLLGAKLILRTTHAMKLTDDGERCYQQAKLLLDQWSALEDQLRGAGDEPVGTLRVRAPHAFGQDQMIEPLTRYLQRYPNVTVDWMLNDRTPDFLSEDIDCAIQVGNAADPSMVAILLYIANLLWTVAYDTYYAMTDRDDDLKIGVKSTAILFGDADRVIILSLQGLALGCLLLAGAHFELGGWFRLGLLGAAACFAWEFWYTRNRDPQRCFRAFLHNHWAGLAIFVGIALDYALR